MAYIGQSIKNGTFSVLDTSGNTYNGSNTTFSLGTQVGSPAQLLVSHDGVIQKPGTDYTLASGGTQITFTTAPASGASIFIVEISGAVGGPMNRDLNGEELILDVDGDTSLHADTDDQIDFKVGGTDQFSIKDGVIEPTTDNDVDIGSSSKEFKDGYFDGTLFCDTLNLAGTAHTAITGGVTDVDIVVVTSSGTYTPTSGTKFVRVYATGGGGGGGGVVPNSSDRFLAAGGNGGNTAVKVFTATELGADASISIGSGGSVSQNDGGNGGDTSFNPAGTGATITGTGGYGGKACKTDGYSMHSEEQHTSTGNGDYNHFGDFGRHAFRKNNSSSTFDISGAGGRSYFGRGGQPIANDISSSYATAGNAGTFGGGGGGAAVKNNNGSNRNGGAGGAGVVVIEEYA